MESLQNPATKSNHLQTILSTKSVLTVATKLCFATIVVGQWIFVYYLLLAYGGSALDGDISDWNQLMPHGHVAGDALGNTTVVIHVLIAFIIMGIGPLQFIPQVRNSFPRFHRINGRVYLTTAAITSLVGLFMVNTRGTVGGLSQYIGISIDALLILVFAYLTFHFALKRKLILHRQWALRLFMVASAVWFYRVGLMFWLAINNGPVGIDFKTFTGPFLDFLTFAQYLVPLGILEIYLRVKQKGGFVCQIGLALILLVSILVLAFGIFAAYKGLWLPKIEKIGL